MEAIRTFWHTALTDAAWLTQARARAYIRILFALSAATVAGWIALSQGGLDLQHKPLGTDFLSFWAASKLALAGHAAQVYDIARHAAAERSAFGGAEAGYSAFFYPPFYLLICLPFALLPYLSSLAVWQAITGYACWRVIRAILGASGKELPLAMLAYPGVFTNLAHGQNAFLTTALFGAAILSLERRPILAGILFGSLAFKPQLGMMIPIALAASNRRRSFIAAVFTVAALAAATVAIFGVDAWRGFFATSSLARIALEQNWIGWEKMQSVFAAVRLLHGGIAFAYIGQSLGALAACTILLLTISKRPGAEAEGALLVVAGMLSSPFLLDYDLMLLAIPLAWITRNALRFGWLSWEKIVVFAAFALPLVSRVLAAQAGIPIGPFVIFALLIVVARRARGLACRPARPELNTVLQPASAP